MSSHWLDRALEALGRLAWRRPWSVLGVGALITALSAALAVTLPVDSSFLGILDEDDPAMVRLAEVTRRFGAASSVVLVITGGEEAARREAALAAVDALEALPMVEDASARVDPELVRRFGLMYVDDAGFERLEQALTRLATPQPGPLTLEAAVAGLRTQLGAQEGGAQGAPPEAAQALERAAELLEWLAAPTPEALDALLARVLSAGATVGEGGAPMREGWIASADGEVYAVDARTRLDPLRVDIGMGGFGGIEAAIDPVRAAHPELSLRFAGLLPGGFQDQQNVLGKVLPLSTLSLGLVLLSLMFIDRRISTALAVGVALVVSLVWTLGLVWFVWGYASLMVSVFGILLFGLGVDYCVHLLSRYNDERVRGLAGEVAMVRTLGRAGRPVLVGALTTMVAFALMTLTDFKAAVHLGVTAALGLGCSAVVMVALLPAAVRVLDRGPNHTPSSMDLPWLDRLVAACLAHPRPVLGACVALLVSTAALAPRFALETDLERIITRDLPALDAAEDLSRAFGGSAEAIFSVSSSVEQARERALAFAALEPVARVDGLHRLIPEERAARLVRNRRLEPTLAQLRLELPRREAVPLDALAAELDALRKAASGRMLQAQAAGRGDLVAPARRLRDAAAALAGGLAGREAELAQAEALLAERVAGALAGLRECVALTEFGPEQLPTSLRDRYYRDGQLLTLVYPRDYRIEFGALQVFKQQVSAVDPEATGTLMVVDQLLRGGVDRLPIALAAIVLSLAGLLYWDLGRAWKVAVAMVPLVLGCTLAVFVVLVLELRITVLMLAAFPLLFGIGIDDGVHILHRWEEEQEDIVGAIAGTGKAILFTSVTTAIGFSILFLTNHAGLEGLAALVCLGVLGCFITSVTVLPVLAQWAHRRGLR